MSSIPNKAMPHARTRGASADSKRGWRDTARVYVRDGGKLARRGISAVRARPIEAAAGVATLLAGLAFAVWRTSRPKQRRRFAFG